MESIVKNSSLFNTSDGNYRNRVDWILPVSVNAVLLSLTTVILFSMIHYGIKTGKWRRNHVLFVDKLNGGWVYTFAVKFACIGLLELVTSQTSFNIGYGLGEDFTCEVVNDIHFVSYSLVLLTNFSFLWIRQRIFYSNRMLSVDYSKFLRFLSVSSLALIGVTGCVVIVFNVIPTNYPALPNGCGYRTKYEDMELIFSICVAAGIIVSEIMLVFLLIYPLQKNLGSHGFFQNLCSCCESSKFLATPPNNSAEASRSSSQTHPLSRHSLASKSKSTSLKQNQDYKETSSEKDAMKKSKTENFAINVLGTEHVAANESKTENVTMNVFTTEKVAENVSKTINFATKLSLEGKRSTRSSHNVKKVMRKTVLFGGFSLLTDIVFLFLNFLLLDGSDPGMRRIGDLIYDLNVMLNLLFVVFSFSTYKQILLSPFRKM